MSVNLTFRCAYCDKTTAIEASHKSKYGRHEPICESCWKDEWMFQAVIDHWDEVEPARKGAILQALTIVESLPEGLAAGLQLRLN